jgi:uncharacterized protein YndB with AHSA1/START domain
VSAPSIDITIYIERSPTDVFSAWASSDALASWFAPMAEDKPDVTLDFIVEGQYSIVMPLPDGSVHTTTGTFREIVNNEKIVMTWRCDAFPDPESLVEVRFSPKGNGCELHLQHRDFEASETRDAHNGGWQACLTQLTVYLTEVQGEPK